MGRVFDAIRIIQQNIETMQKVIRMLGRAEAKKGQTVPRRKISAAGRKRIAAAQRARWAKIKAAKK